MAGGTSVDENYAFRGMHHIFDDHAGHKSKTPNYHHIFLKPFFSYSS